MFFVLQQAQNKEKIMNPHKELHLRPLDHTTPMFSISSQNSKLTKHLSYSITLKTVINTHMHHH